MTKRDLVKWLEKRAEKARNEADELRKKAIKESEEEIYKSIELDRFVEDVVKMYSEILKRYNGYLSSIDAIEGVSLSKFYYKFGYTDLERRYTSKSEFRETVKEAINIRSEKYNEVVRNASEEVRKVISTYDTVILTVKNLPTAKDGLEYLKKLGFDTEEIEPAEHRKQLPATTAVNVDINYLMLSKK